jgi:hypothetical protein
LSRKELSRVEAMGRVKAHSLRLGEAAKLLELIIGRANGFGRGTGREEQRHSNMGTVVAGPTFKVDVSRARILLPDGRQADTRPVGVGDRLVILLNQPRSESPVRGSASQIYIASTTERIANSDKIVTH